MGKQWKTQYLIAIMKTEYFSERYAKKKLQMLPIPIIIIQIILIIW